MARISGTSLNNAPSDMALENQDWDAAYRRLMAREDLPGMRHEAIGAIVALVLVLGFAGWASAFVGSF